MRARDRPDRHRADLLDDHRPQASRTSTHEHRARVARAPGAQGVDYFTIHAGVLREHLPFVNAAPDRHRLAAAARCSPSGCSHHGRQNLMYELWDEICDVMRQYDVTFSIGDGLRPGGLADATDDAQLARARDARRAHRARLAQGRAGDDRRPGPRALRPDRVQHEAPAHGSATARRSTCSARSSPTSSPATTTSRAASARPPPAYHGAAMLCYVTPKEHLGLPKKDDVKQGCIAYKIAAHAADVALGIPGARDRDDELTKARAALNWEKHFELSFDPDTARAYHDEDLDVDTDFCAMCGHDWCSVRISKEIVRVRLAARTSTTPGSGRGSRAALTAGAARDPREARRARARGDPPPRQQDARARWAPRRARRPPATATTSDDEKARRAPGRSSAGEPPSGAWKSDAPGPLPTAGASRPNLTPPGSARNVRFRFRRRAIANLSAHLRPRCGLTGMQLHLTDENLPDYLRTLGPRRARRARRRRAGRRRQHQLGPPGARLRGGPGVVDREAGAARPRALPRVPGQHRADRLRAALRRACAALRRGRRAARGPRLRPRGARADPRGPRRRRAHGPRARARRRRGERARRALGALPRPRARGDAATRAWRTRSRTTPCAVCTAITSSRCRSAPNDFPLSAAAARARARALRRDADARAHRRRRLRALPRAARARSSTATCRRATCCSPPRGPKLLDAEIAHVGDPAFDLGTLLAHLVLPALARGELGARAARRGARPGRRTRAAHGARRAGASPTPRATRASSCCAARSAPRASRRWREATPALAVLARAEAWIRRPPADLGRAPAGLSARRRLGRSALRRGLALPVDPPVVEVAVRDHVELHDLEVRREVEVGGRQQGRVAHPEEARVAAALVAEDAAQQPPARGLRGASKRAGQLARRQDRKARALEELADQARADHLGRGAAPEVERASRRKRAGTSVTGSR